LRNLTTMGGFALRLIDAAFVFPALLVVLGLERGSLHAVAYVNGDYA